MNNDLIRRSATCNQLISSIDWLREHDYELYCAIGDSICCCIDEMPTAYDVDKVVEQLEAEQEKLDTSIFARECDDWYGQYCNGISEGIDRAIEIISAKNEPAITQEADDKLER